MGGQSAGTLSGQPVEATTASGVEYGWCEARYLRTIEWLADVGLSKRDFLLLWSFALLDDQLGFAIDVGVEYEKVFGKDDASKIMRELRVTT